MYFDGTLNLEGVGAGVLLISPHGEQPKYVLQIHYKASNNGALIHGLRIAVSLGIKRLLAFGDCKVVIKQVTTSGTASRTQWMLTALKFVNSKATSRGSSSSMFHRATTSSPMYSLN
jgi:ribonuclease HI